MVLGPALLDPAPSARTPVVAFVARRRVWSALWVTTVVAASQAFGRALSISGVDGYLLLTCWTVVSAVLLTLVAWPQPIRVLGVSRWLALLLVWAGLSTLWSPDPLQTVKELVAVGSLLLCGIAGAKAGARQVAVLTCAALTVLGAVSVALVVLAPGVGTVVALESADGSTRWAVGVFGWNSAFGMAGSLGGVLAAGLWLDLPSASRRVIRAAAPWAVVLLVNVGVILVSRSATDLVSFAAGLVVISVVRWHWVRVAALVVACVVALGAALGRLEDWASFALGLLGRDLDLTGRLPIWRLMLDVTEYRRIGGLGFGNSPDISEILGATVPHSHNGYLQMLLELGWTGLLLFALLLIQVTVRLVRAQAWPWLGVLGVFLVANVANDYALSRSIATLMLGLLVSVAAARHLSQDPGDATDPP